jgi:hypothetical protein
MGRIAAGCVALVALGMLTVPVTQAAPGADSVTLAGQLQLEPCAKHLKFAVDPGSHMLLVARQFDPKCWSDRRYVDGLDVYSTLTMAQVGSWALDPGSNMTPGGNNLGSLGPLTVDLAHHRAFVVYDDGNFGHRVMVVDLGQLNPGARTIKPAAIYLVPGVPDSSTTVSADDPTGAAGASTYCSATAFQFGGDGCLYSTGMSYDTATNSLLAVEAPILSNSSSSFSTHGPSQPRTYLSSMDASSGAKRWMMLLGRCSAPLSSTSTSDPSGGWVPQFDPVMSVNSGHGVTVAAGCLYSNSLTRGTYGAGTDPSKQALAGGSMMTYMVSLTPEGSLQKDSSGNAVAQSFIGRPNVLAGLADPGSGRIFYAASPPLSQAAGVNAGGPTAVGFDAAHQVYIGGSTIGPAQDDAGRFNMAVGGGRLYSIGSDGVVVTDTTSTPQGQGLHFSRPLCAGSARSYVTDVVADPGTRKVFAWANVCGDSSNHRPYLLVYQDGIPSLAQGKLPNPDDYTQQIAEQAGVTQRQFGAHGEAAGARLRLVGGTTGLLKGASAGAYDFVLQNASLANPPQQLNALSQADYNTREMELGKVRNADVSNYQASAEALAAGIDPTTKSQLQGQSHPWPYKESDCSDPGTAKPPANTYGNDTRSFVTCDLASTTADSIAESGPAGLTLGSTVPTTEAVPVLVGHTRSEAKVTLAATGEGTIADTVSEVRSTVIGPVTIQAIRTEARCVAHGRKGTAKCTFTRSINGASNAGQPVGSGACAQQAGVDTCGQLLAALNAVRPGILVFSMPGPDSRLGFFDGSAGGYQSVAQRELYAHLQDNVLNYDSAVMVPGLHAVYNNDTPDTPSRLDVQLANVQSEAHYGISKATFLEDHAPPQLTDALPPVAAASVPDVTRASAGGSSPGILATIGHLIEQFLAGLAWLLRSPLQAVLMGGMLTMFGMPIYLAIRRRRLEALGEGA